MTKPVQLDGDGPHVTPIAQGFVGLGISQGQLPAQIRLVLKGGQELHVPIEELALRRLYKQLHGLYSEKP
jgi:hypothetical protein